MNRTFLSWTASLLLAWTFPGAATAQMQAVSDQSLPPPVAPFVAPVPDPAQWSIEITPANADPTAGAAPDSEGDGAKKPHRVVHIDSSRAGDLKRDFLTYADGDTAELWYAGGMLLKPSASGSVMVVDPTAQTPNAPRNGDRPGDPVIAAGFPGLAWLKLDYFDQVLTFQKQSCYHYATGHGLEAWISVKTGLPVASQRDGMLYVYTFSDAAGLSLALPPSYQAARDAYSQIAKRRKQVEKDLGSS